MDGNERTKLFYFFGFLLFVVTRCVLNYVIFDQVDGTFSGEPTPNPISSGDSVVGLVGIHHLVAVQPVPGRNKTGFRPVSSQQQDRFGNML